MKSFGNSHIARITSMLVMLMFVFTLLPANFALAADSYTMTVTDDTTAGTANKDDVVTLNIQLDGTMRGLKMVQYAIVYDPTEFNAEIGNPKNPSFFETEWWNYVKGGETGIGYIAKPDAGIVTLESDPTHKRIRVLINGSGSIDEWSDIKDAVTAVVGKIKFTALKDVKDVSKSFTLTEEAVQKLVGGAGVPQDLTVKQLVSKATPEPIDPDKEKVDAVIAKIAALPEADALTLDDETAVNEAKTAFDALSAENQAKVTNSDKLTKAVAKIEELKKPPVGEGYTMVVTDDTTAGTANKDDVVTLNIQLDGTMRGLKMVQYAIVYDPTEFNAEIGNPKNPSFFETEWWNYVKGGETGIGYIAKPDAGIVTLESDPTHKRIRVLINGSGSIDEWSDIKDAVTAVVGKIKFTALKDVKDVSKSFTLTEEAVQKLVGGAGVPQDLTVKQLVSKATPEPIDPDKEKVDAVIAKIAALPEADALTLDDETAVNEAKTAFDALSAENQAKVTNSDKLTKALAKIEELKAAASDQEKVDAVIKMINDLPATDALTLADKEAVATANAAYEALGELKGKVTNADKLTAAINKIADLEKDKDAADKVIALIDAIDAEITLDSEKGITDARTAYDALTPAQKALISAEKLEVLTNAEAELKGIKADKAAADNVIKMIDDICASEITVGSRAAIDAAKKAYDELNDNGQKFVGEDKYNELLEADKKCKELEDAADQDTKDTAAAEAFTRAVNDLEDATYENVDTVEAAAANLRSQYDSLTDGAKAKIDEKVLAKLTEIEEKVKTIKNDIAKANETKALIKAIGTVTLDSADAIKAARDSYDALENAEQKALVDNAPDGENTATLEAAEKAYAAIKEDNDKADATIKLIDDIGEVTIDSGDKIKAARESFDSLTDAQKEIVKKAGKEDILVKAEADYKAIVDANKPVVSGNKKPAFTDMFDGGLYVVVVENVPTGKKVTVDGIEGYEYKDADGKINYVVASNREMNKDNITVEDATDAKPFILGAFTNPTGALNAADAYIINKLSALIKDDTTNPLFADPYTSLRADVNGDGIVNAADALLIARHAAGDATAPALKFVGIATIDAE